MKEKFPSAEKKLTLNSKKGPIHQEMKQEIMILSSLLLKNWKNFFKNSSKCS